MILNVITRCSCQKNPEAIHSKQQVQQMNRSRRQIQFTVLTIMQLDADEDQDHDWRMWKQVLTSSLMYTAVLPLWTVYISVHSLYIILLHTGSHAIKFM